MVSAIFHVKNSYHKMESGYDSKTRDFLTRARSFTSSLLQLPLGLHVKHDAGKRLYAALDGRDILSILRHASV